jgi:NAD(P)-dependent dehydrogenase (short-subunit alcohol dehydrogenase family)
LNASNEIFRRGELARSSQQEVNVHMNPIYNFKGQVALVTGAAKGMGLATARMFAQSGASVVLADLDGGLAAKEAERIVVEGGTAIDVACDVADEAQVAAMLDRAVAEYGRLDMAFNNAGIQVPPSDAADEPIEHFERVTAVNQRGVWACMKHELRVMRDQGSGAIVNNSSIGGLIGLPQRAAYHGTKHAVLGMTKSAGVEYAPRGIRINAVCPGTIETPMVAEMLEGQAEAMAEIMKQQSIGRLGRAEEVAAAVLWLCSPGASFVIGVGLAVDGGFTAH